MNAKTTAPDESSLEQLLQVLDRLPFVSNLKKDVSLIRSVLYERRPARLACVGHLPSGRSTLGSALFGKQALPTEDVAPGQWIQVSSRDSRVDWLEVDLTMALSDIRAALEEAQPDLLLVVLPPEEIGEGLPSTLSRVRDLHQAMNRAGDAKVQVVGVIADAETVAPGEDLAHAIDELRQRFDGALKTAELPPATSVAISARDLDDEMASLSRLSRAIFEALPEQARMEAVRALVHAAGPRREVANLIVKSCSTIALTVGLAPVPMSDALLIAPLQVVMVSSVAHLGGRPWNRQAALEWIGSMGVVGGLGFGFRWAAQQLVKVIPGAGSIVSASVAGAGTVALGQSAIAYFLRERPIEELAAPGAHRTAGTDDVVVEDEPQEEAPGVDEPEAPSDK